MNSSNLDFSIKFISINIALITISDTRNINDDKSGDLLKERINKFGHNVTNKVIIKDDIEKIKSTLINFANDKLIDVIITTGGTGLTGRDITPEAIKEIADKEIPGFGELFRELSYKTIGTSAMQSRACAVLANGKYIFALPGSSGGVTDAWDGILKYQLDINHKPCNFVELFPRLREK